MDEEFRITDVEEDRNGNAILACFDHIANASFNVCYGDFEERKRQLEYPERYVGRWLKVKYQTRYKDSKLPQFGVGVCFRDCDDKGSPLE